MATQQSYAATVVSIQANGPLAGVVGGFQFNIIGPVGTDSTVFTPSLPGGWVDGTFGLPGATVNYFDGQGSSSLPSGPLGSFQTVTANLDLNSFLLFDQTATQIPLTDYVVQQVGSNYDINAVPIPSTILLLGGGLLALVGLRRRRS